MKKILILVLFFSFSLILLGCDTNDIDDTALENMNLVQEDFNIKNTSETVINILEDNQLLNLVEWIHPEKWIRFSPYTYIDMDNHNVVFPENIINDMDQTYVWGYTDWKWDLIDMSISDYVTRYIGNIDYIGLANEVLVNENTFRWNNLNNIEEAYVDGEYIEYYISWFDAKYEWMDWRSLTIVFEEFKWQYYIVWIISGSWTI